MKKIYSDVIKGCILQHVLDDGAKCLDSAEDCEALANDLATKLTDLIEGMLWLPCCHVSGMHDPVHFSERKYICASQQAAALQRFCRELCIDPETKSRPECRWCQDYPEKMKGEGVHLFDKDKATTAS